MDSLTTHYVARELDARWRGRRLVAGALVDSPRGAVLHVEGSDPVAFDLAAPEPLVRPAEAPRDTLRIAGWSIASVEAPLDERRIIVALERAGKFRGSATRRATLEVSVMPIARGALLRDAGGGVIAAIGSRPRRAVAPRPELTDAEVERAARARDVDALLRGRWMSAPVASWLVAEPTRAAERYRSLRSLPPAQPSHCGDRVLPFPLCADPTPAGSLVSAIGRATAAADARDKPSARQRALERMRQELERSSEAPRIREAADHLMLLGDTAAPSAVLLGDGTPVPVEPRPGESALRAAERLYKAARSLERAAERLPARIAAMEASAEHPAARPAGRKSGRTAPRRRARALPYRVYHSSGGLEILVGRGASSNDALTFKVASPGDVWLHARGAAGAHVLLRWTRDEPPPARDLQEAAMLAAWHSKARGSAVVPVDWTRRKYVRRPRGGRPGLVLLTRSETLMVRPDEAVERALRGSA